MIVTCPACSSRYRIREDKISGRGARITCPSCQHKFVVHKEQAPMVVGGGDARGVPVTFARGGKNLRGDFPEEDDENDVPTTVMPHGSQLAQSIRAAAEAARAREAQMEAAAAPAAARVAAASAQPSMDLRAQGRVAPPSEAPSATPDKAGGSSLGLWMVLFIVILVVLAVLIATDTLPVRALIGL